MARSARARSPIVRCAGQQVLRRALLRADDHQRFGRRPPQAEVPGRALDARQDFQFGALDLQVAFDVRGAVEDFQDVPQAVLGLDVTCLLDEEERDRSDRRPSGRER